MLILTTPTIEGKEIIEYYGLVTGDSLLGANMYKDVFSGVRDVVGGRTSKYEEELTNARDLATKSMQEKAENKGANAIIEKRWAITAIVLGILVGFISAYLCIHLHLIIFGFNIMYIVSPIAAGFVETVIARRKYGKSTGAISAILTFIIINIYGWIILGIITNNPAELSLITIIAIILTIQAAFPIFMNYVLFVVGLGIIKKLVAFLVFLPSKIRGTAVQGEATRTDGPPADEKFIDELDFPLLTIPPAEGGRVQKSIGLVIGEAVAQETETDGFIEKLSKINEPNNLDDFNLGDARKVAISRMFENAKALGANTVVDVSLGYNSMGGFQGSALIVTATGTAVIYE